MLCLAPILMTVQQKEQAHLWLDPRHPRLVRRIIGLAGGGAKHQNVHRSTVLPFSSSVAKHSTGSLLPQGSDNCFGRPARRNDLAGT